MKPPRFVLASTSPRRRELLSSMGWEYDVMAPRADESPVESESPAETALRLARSKALSVSSFACGLICLGADTIVDVDGINFGKPDNRSDSYRMLRILSGRCHYVHTGVALAKGNEILADGLETTKVRFACLDESEMEEFVQSGIGDDKAGSYAIQGIGATMIEGIEGCYYNVMGIPLRLLYSLFKKLGLMNIMPVNG